MPLGTVPYHTAVSSRGGPHPVHQCIPRTQCLQATVHMGWTSGNEVTPCQLFLLESRCEIQFLGLVFIGFESGLCPMASSRPSCPLLLGSGPCPHPGSVKHGCLLNTCCVLPVFLCVCCAVLPRKCLARISRNEALSMALLQQTVSRLLSASYRATLPCILFVTL